VALAYMPIEGDHYAYQGLSHSRQAPSMWGGWVRVGDVEVTAGAFADRALAQTILDSIHAS
jgi:hypothetical protein